MNVRSSFERTYHPFVASPALLCTSIRSAFSIVHCLTFIGSFSTYMQSRCFWSSCWRRVWSYTLLHSRSFRPCFWNPMVRSWQHILGYISPAFCFRVRLLNDIATRGVILQAWEVQQASRRDHVYASGIAGGFAGGSVGALTRMFCIHPHKHGPRMA